MTLGVISSVDEKEAAEDVRDSEERESMVAGMIMGVGAKNPESTRWPLCQ